MRVRSASLALFLSEECRLYGSARNLRIARRGKPSFRDGHQVLPLLRARAMRSLRSAPGVRLALTLPRRTYEGTAHLARSLNRANVRTCRSTAGGPKVLSSVPRFDPPVDWQGLGRWQRPIGGLRRCTLPHQGQTARSSRAPLTKANVLTYTPASGSNRSSSSRNRSARRSSRCPSRRARRSRPPPARCKNWLCRP